MSLSYEGTADRVGKLLDPIRGRVAPCGQFPDVPGEWGRRFLQRMPDGEGETRELRLMERRNGRSRFDPSSCPVWP